MDLHPGTLPVMPDQAVTGRRGTGCLPLVRVPGFVGRGQELTVLADALAGPPAVVLVEGEAGIGKTRLVREYLKSSDGMARRSLMLSCPPLARPHPYGPLADALRRAVPDQLGDLGLSPLAGVLRPLFPEWSEQLPPAPEPAEDSAMARHRVFAAIGELLGCLGTGLLVAEDAHWADEATGEFLVYLASGQAGPVSLVVTARPEDVPAGSPLPRLSGLAAGERGRRIIVGPLDLAEVSGLMSSMLGGEQVSAAFAAFVHATTEGVPLAAEELVRLLAVRDDLVVRGGEWARRRVERIAIPATVRDAVLERVGRLGPEGTAVVRAVAVLAEPVPEAIVASVAGIPDGPVLAGLREATDCGLLAEDERGLVSFRHALAARAVYEATAVSQRRGLHLRAGRELESCSPPPLTRLARHFREAGEAAKWAGYAEQAAALALAAGDEAGAALLLCDAIVNAGLPPGEMARLADKTPLLAVTGNSLYSELARALRAALTVSSLAAAEEAEVRFQLGRVLIVREETDVGQGEIKQALRGLPPGSFRAAKAMTYLGTLGTTGTAAEHLRWLRRSARCGGSLERGERLRLLVDRASALLQLGAEDGWAEADRIPRDAATPMERQQVARGWVNVTDSAIVWGRYAEARRRAAGALELCEKYRYVRMLGGVLVNQAHLDWLTGAWDGLAARAAGLVGDELLHPTARLEAMLVAGLLDAALGDHDRAAGRFGHVLGEALRSGNVQYMAEPAAALARIALARGDHGAALEVTEEPAGIIARKGTWILAADLAPVRAGALAAAGRISEAASLADGFASGLRGRAAPAPRAGLALCRAILAEARGEHAGAAALFARAALAWQGLPRPYDALLARERQACCLLAADKRAAGLELLSGARAGLAGLGAAGDVGRVTGMLREHGMSVPPTWRGGRRGYGGSLSPREAEVVKLVAAGHTNAEAAAALSRSPNTVAMQRKSAMRKLGVSSRADLVAKAAELGIVR